MKILSPTRSSLWWNHLILPLTFWVYLISFRNFDLLVSGWLCVRILLASASVAVLGYLINDYFDRNEDRKAGKPNFFQEKPNTAILLLPAIMLVSGALWYSLPLNLITISLLVSEVALFIIYSAPPIRVKHHGVGVLVDAMYSRVIPVLTILSFWEQALDFIFITSGIWMLLVGVRNILLHQLDDIENDRMSGTRTIVQRYGVERVRFFILRYVLPLEIGILGICLYFLSPQLHYVFISIAIFIVFLIVRYKVWRKKFRSESEWAERALYLPNDFYEDFLPLSVLIIFSIDNPWLIIGIILHLLLFPKISQRLMSDGHTIWLTVAPYLRKMYYNGLLQVWLKLSYWGNNLIFHFFLLFGVNLKRENLTVLEYFKKRLTK